MKRSILLTVILVLFTFTVAFSSSVTIDKITGGVWQDGFTTKLFPNEDVHFHIRYTNNSGSNVPGIKNGFRVWTTGGTTFIPLSGEILYPEIIDLFNLGFFPAIWSADGVGADTLSIGAGSIGGGLPNGFDEIVLMLSTGGINEGETLCIDSAYFPPSGVWRWAASPVDISPDWSGQQCFTAECPSCAAPQFTNCKDTLNITTNNIISYTFEAFTLGIPNYVRFFLIEGPGYIDSMTGEWSYSIPAGDMVTFDSLKVGTYGCAGKCNFGQCWIVLDFTFDTPADLNADGVLDISDLIYLVAYMFQSGPPPIPLMAADMNGDLEIDIADLIYMVNYMFNGGPPPVE